MIRPNEDLPPNFIVVFQDLYALLKNVWQSSETLWGKIMMTPSCFAYTLSSYSLQFVPRPLQSVVRCAKHFFVRRHQDSEFGI